MKHRIPIILVALVALLHFAVCLQGIISHDKPTLTEETLVLRLAETGAICRVFGHWWSTNDTCKLCGELQ